MYYARPPAHVRSEWVAVKVAKHSLYITRMCLTEHAALQGAGRALSIWGLVFVGVSKRLQQSTCAQQEIRA